jgi:Fe-S cluster biogenesis protein NfuA
VLHDLAPLLRIDHCVLQLAGFNSASGDLRIRISGSCPDCLASPAMFATAIEAHVRQRVTEVNRVTIEG